MNELTIVNGKIQLALDKVKNKKSPSNVGKLDFHWDELFHFHAESIVLENVDFNLKLGNTSDSHLGGHLAILRVAQWTGRGGLGYSAYVNLKNLQGGYLKSLTLPEKIDSVQGEAYLNALGLNLESLLISFNGLEGSVFGQIKGNILEPKNLVADATVGLKGDLEKALKTFLPKPPKDLPNGLFTFSGKLQGNLAKLLETLKLEGDVSIKNFNYQKWVFEEFQANCKWMASATGGEISLLKGTIKSQDRPRVGGFQPGGGGKIEIGPVKWVVGSMQPMKIPLHFEHAHLHWLAAPILEKIYSLDFRLNGDLEVNYAPPVQKKSWEFRVNLNSWLEKFQLDNQHFHQNRPMREIFKIPRIGLNGSLLINSAGVQPLDLNVGLPHSKMRLSGKIDSNSIYDLHAAGNIDLSDLGQVAENEIRGTGNLNVAVHGPASNVLVDVDTDLKDSYYLGLFLGGVKGRITWDDDPSHIIFTQVKVNHESSIFDMEGILDVGKADSVDLKVKFGNANIQDLIQVFGNLTKNFWWFPQKLNGFVQGQIDITGGISFSKLKILANLNGKTWEYLGERFKTVKLIGGYDQGKYFISDAQVLKRIGSLIGKVSYDSSTGLDWDLYTRDFLLSDLDLIAQLDVPIRGKLNIQSNGSGLEGAIKSSSQFELYDFSVRGVAAAPSHLNIKTLKGITTALGTLVGGQGSLDIVYDSNPNSMSSFRGELKQLDFSPILLLLNARSVQDRALEGKVSGELELNFKAGEFEKVNGNVTVSEYVLARQDTRFSLDQPFESKITRGDFDIRNVLIKGNTGTLVLNLRSKSNRLEGGMSGELDTSLIEFFVPSILQATGTSKVDFSIGGTWKDPTFLGKIELDGDAIRVASLDSPFENVTGTMLLRQNMVSFQKVQGDLGGGRITSDGQIVINADRYPTVSIKSTISNAKVRVYPFQYAKISGNIEVHGDDRPYWVDGTIFVDSALSKEKVMSQKGNTGSLKTMQYAPPPSKQGEGSYPKFKLNIDVQAQKGILIQNDLFQDVQAKGNLKLVNTLEAPRVLGIVEVTQGKLVFKNNVFQIQSARANFDNPTLINPSFDLNANTEVHGIKIRMYATGRPDKIKIEFTSNPAMQESEILSLLTVGLTSTDAKKLNANDLSVVQQGEAASLVLHSLDFNREIEDKTGFRVQLDESVNVQQGTSAFRPLSQAESAAAPQITIRKKLGDRLSLSAGSTVGAGTNRSNQVNMDFSVNHDVSVTGVFNNYGTSGNTDVQSSTQQTQKSFGLDLKFQKRFK